MKTQNLKGFRDFLPVEKRQRDYVLGVMKQVARRFGFEPLETPTLEYAELLLGKYGDEADKLVYTFEDKGGRAVGLRYDQTVPTARVLNQYQNELPKYFRRYQTQNVFRADKPQKGRYREFRQFDLDIFGSTSPLSDAEIIACTYTIFVELGFESVQLLVNDRQTLIDTLKPFTNPKVDVFSLIQSIDKLDKQTPAEVTAELEAKGLDSQTAKEALTAIEKAAVSDNLQQIVDTTQGLGVPTTALIPNPKLARGLDYYTGMILEITVPEYTVGSLGGGGRYDNLIEDLDGPTMPAVGIGLGFDRIVEAAAQLKLIPINTSSSTVLVTIFDDTTQSFQASTQTAAALRKANISSELYPTADKLGKQFKVADQKQIPWVVIIGETERTANQVTIKDMRSGEQQQIDLMEAIKKVS